MKPKLPAKPTRGQDVEDFVVNSKWLGKVVDCLEWLLEGYKPGKGISIKGRTVSLARRGSGMPVSSSSSSNAYVCKITGSPTAGIYPVDVYDSWEGNKIGSGYAPAMKLHVSQKVATGDWIVAPSTLVSYLPGEES